VTAPLATDAETLALAHFDKGAQADFLAKGVNWTPTDVEVSEGVAGMLKKGAQIVVRFEGGVPKAGTIEFFFKANWASVPGPAPATDGVARHVFWWAPMSGEGMLSCYYLDEFDYMGARYASKKGKLAVTVPQAIRPGEWHHVAVCWEGQPDGGMAGRLFVDGLRANAGVDRWPAPIAFQNEISIGGMPGSGTWPNAWIDEVRISCVQRYKSSFPVRYSR
jgi:hypothetical protein